MAPEIDFINSFWDLAQLPRKQLFEQMHQNLLQFLAREKQEGCPLSFKSDLDSLEKAFDESIDLLVGQLGQLGPDSIAISFNGGKDCTAMLYLYLYALSVYQRQNGGSAAYQKPVVGLYVSSKDNFAEMESFVFSLAKKANLELFVWPGSMKEGLGAFLEKHSSIKAVLIGTRSTDPRGKNVGLVQPTDPDWPSVLRVHPVLHWSMLNVWQLLIGLRLPYCSLYSMGYTSLGLRSSTHPNPALKVRNVEKFYHASFLSNEELERGGRSSN